MFGLPKLALRQCFIFAPPIGSDGDDFIVFNVISPNKSRRYRTGKSHFRNADGRTRTGTGRLSPTDFKSVASAISPHRRCRCDCMKFHGTSKRNRETISKITGRNICGNFSARIHNSLGIFRSLPHILKTGGKKACRSSPKVHKSNVRHS